MTCDASGLEQATGVVRKIAFGGMFQAVPTRPAPGAVIDWASETGYFLIGNREDGDLADLDVDSIAATPREDTLEIDAPLAQNREDEIIFKIGPDNVTFSCYSVSTEVFALSSTARVLNDVVQEDTCITFRSMIVEVAGVGFDYYPKVRVFCSGTTGGIKELKKANFTAKCFGASEVGIKSGLAWYNNIQ